MFKEFNRVKKERKPITTDSEIVGNPSTEVVGNPLSIPKLKRKATYPVVPDGEDQTSFERHNRQIKLELKKTRPNQVVLQDLISRSYAMRRIDILENGYSVTEIFKMYPFLSKRDQVC